MFFFIFRYSARPREILVECCDPTPCELTMLLSEEVANVQSFLNDHRYDPTEIYQDEFLEEIKDIPDPKMDPFSILEDFLAVLNSMGLLFYTYRMILYFWVLFL